MQERSDSEQADTMMSDGLTACEMLMEACCRSRGECLNDTGVIASLWIRVLGMNEKYTVPADEVNPLEWNLVEKKTALFRRNF